MTIFQRDLTPDLSDGVDPRVQAVLDAGATAVTDVSAPGEAAALAAFHNAGGSRFSAVSLRAATLATAAFGVVVIGGGGAAAATGSLPGAAQDTARSMLAKIGISVPGSDEHAGSQPDSRDSGDGAPTTNGDNGTNGKGSQISQLATDPSTSGLQKGIAVSTAASGGKSQAGQHGSADASNHPAPPVSVPNTGGHAGTGMSTADTASGGHASAGASNAGTIPPR